MYDITDFIPLHPGSTKLLMAAGGSVEPFWAMYAVHLNNPTVAGLLEQYRCLPPSYIHTLSHSPFYYISTFSRIGNLSASDAAAQAEELAASDNPFAGNPLHNFEFVKNMTVSLQAIQNATLPLL